MEESKKIYLIRLPLICNFNCQFCFLERRERNLTDFFRTQILKEIFDAKKSSAEKVIFSGGEPTLVKELPFFINYAKKIGIKEVEIQTNALLCSYKDYTEKLKNAGLDSVLIGLHSHEEKIFDFLTQTKGYFSRVLEGIKNLFDCKFSVSFNHAITKLTHKKLKEYVEFIIKNFGKPQKIFLTLVYPSGRCWNHKELIPRVSEVTPYFLETLQYCQKLGIKVLTPHCGMPGFPLCLLDKNGSSSINLRNLISTERKNIRTREFNCVNIKVKRCQDCQYNEVCVGIALNYRKLYGVKEFEF